MPVLGLASAVTGFPVSRARARTKMNGSLISDKASGKVTVVARHKEYRHRHCHTHLNTLWSIWYGLVVTALQAYIAVHAAARFFEYLELPWPAVSAPHMEMRAYVILTGSAVLLLPVFLATAIFKVGNLANDGFKLGRSIGMCSSEPSNSKSLGAGGVRSIWRHCGPTAPLLHIVTAMCMLLPRLLMEARLILAGFLPKDVIWRTDLDFLFAQRDRMFVLNFMTSSRNANMTFQPTLHPLDLSTISPMNKINNLALSSGDLGQELTLIDYPKWNPVSPELFNYILALFVYGIRYSAVFWNTNKWFGVLFSVQILMNGAQCLLMYAGVSILYKVHIIGPLEALPFLHKGVGLSPNVPQHLLLNRDVTLALFIFSSFLVIKSSLVLYLYGYSRLNAFVNRERSRRLINIGEGRHAWGYFIHCAALCVLIAMTVCQAPLLYDSIVVYRGSLNFAVLAFVVGAVVHLFLWVLLWLVLTIKQHWQFKLRVTIGRAVVRSAQSIKLVTEVELLSSTTCVQPLLVIGNGRTYTISDPSPKKAIMSVIQKSAAEKKCLNQGFSNNITKDCLDREEEQIYWLRPKSSTPKHSPDSATSDRLDWIKKNPLFKPKVTFDPNSTTFKSSKGGGDSEDEGDYAKLRELPLISGVEPEQSDDGTVSEENKLLANAHMENIKFSNCDLLNHGVGDYEDPSPLLTPEPQDPPGPPPHPHPPVASEAHQLAIPRLLKRSDSGMSPDELTLPSESVTVEASGGFPPEQTEIGGSPTDSSEMSSGILSNSSREFTTANAQKRSICANDLPTDGSNKVQKQWRIGSMLRDVKPLQTDQTYNGYSAQNCVDSTYGLIRNNLTKKDQNYRNNIFIKTSHQQELANAPYKPQLVYSKSPPVINEEEDVVIRPRVSRTEVTPLVSTVSEPFSRSTNMKLSSFTDRPVMSATLPYYPTQLLNLSYPQCSTMPLHTTASTMQSYVGGGISCNPFPQQHSTIPIHHNGVRLLRPNLYTKQRCSVPIKGFPHDSTNHTFMKHRNLNSKIMYRAEQGSANHTTVSSGGLNVHT